MGTCGGKQAGKVKFNNGVLSIEDSTGNQHWSSATKVASMGGDGAAKRALPKFFGPGDNKCITDKNCVIIHGDEDLKGKSIKMAPNRDYLYAQLTPTGMEDYDYSITVKSGRCWVEAWEGEDLTGYKDIFTEDSVETTYLKGKSGLLTRQGSNDANSYRTHSTSDYQTYFVYKNYEKDVGGATWGASYYRPNNILAAYYKVARIQRNDKMKRYFPTMRSPSAKGMWGGDFSK